MYPIEFTRDNLQMKLTTAPRRESPEMSKTLSKDRVPDSAVGEVVDVDIEDDILMAQGHRPAMKRTFNLLSTLGLGFRQVLQLVTNPVMTSTTRGTR